MKRFSAFSFRHNIDTNKSNNKYEHKQTPYVKVKIKKI